MGDHLELALLRMSTALVWLLLDWRPRLTFSVGSMRKLGGFSLKIFAATVIS